MYIMTANGWKQLAPRNYDKPGHTPSLLERMGVPKNHNGLKALADYCNGEGHGVYFTYNADGSFYQSRPALNPLPGMR